MTGFTHDQMYRPLFEEPSIDIERDNEWSSPLGFLVGGGANMRYQHLGQQYYDAACTLAECIKQQDIADCHVANPVLYLYRHSIELFLKAIMQDAAKTHRLYELAEEFRGFIKKEFRSDVPEWIVSRMKELGAIDPNSTAFRYNLNYDKASKSDHPVSGEYHVDLHHLRSSMAALNAALVGAIAMIACSEGRSERQGANSPIAFTNISVLQDQAIILHD